MKKLIICLMFLGSSVGLASGDGPLSSEEESKMLVETVEGIKEENKDVEAFLNSFGVSLYSEDFAEPEAPEVPEFVLYYSHYGLFCSSESDCPRDALCLRAKGSAYIDDPMRRCFCPKAEGCRGAR